jgi:RimJ/RimL family protein N-acetyltransferase
MDNSMTFSTERLQLVPLSLTHATQEYANWLNDNDVNKYLETKGGQTVDTIKDFINSQIEKKTNIWAIIDRSTNKHIGNIKIDPINTTHQFGEYGILIGDKNYWGKGYAYEASIVIINYFFSRKDYLRKINLGVLKDNVAAVHLYEKIGFKIEGVYEKHLIYGDVEHDVIRMAIFKNDFIKQ